jgi:hypothetical protein
MRTMRTKIHLPHRDSVASASRALRRFSVIADAPQQAFALIREFIRRKKSRHYLGG